MADRSFNGGLVQRYDVPGGREGQGSLGSRLSNVPYGESEQGQTSIRFLDGGVLTYEKPIIEFGGDINLLAGTTTLLTAGEQIPNRCVGARFILLVGTVAASINGGPFRTVLNSDTFQGCLIKSMLVRVDALSSVTVQAVGTGD